MINNHEKIQSSLAIGLPTNEIDTITLPVSNTQKSINRRGVLVNKSSVSLLSPKIIELKRIQYNQYLTSAHYHMRCIFKAVNHLQDNYESVYLNILLYCNEQLFEYLVSYCMCIVCICVYLIYILYFFSLTDIVYWIFIANIKT
jgi:hypothetical protein